MNAALDESVLDSADRLGEADREGLLRALATAGAQIRESLVLTGEAGVTEQLAGLRPRAVLLAADAAADDAGDALRALTGGPDAAAPVVRHDGSGLPLWAGAADVLLAVAQYPGVPTIPALADAAARRGMTVLGVGGSESSLEEACGRNRMPFVALPSGRHPRAALWGLLVPLLVAAGELGLLGRAGESVGPGGPGGPAGPRSLSGPGGPAGPGTLGEPGSPAGPGSLGAPGGPEGGGEPADGSGGPDGPGGPGVAGPPRVPDSVEADLAAAADLLDLLAERVRPTRETFVNPAKSLALDIGASLPVIWGTSAAAGSAARRLAGQLAAVAGRPAVWGTLPGAAQRLGGLLAGGGARVDDDLFRDRVDDPEPAARARLVLVRDAAEAIEVRRLAEQVVAAAAERAVPVTEVAAEEGAGPLGRFASLVGMLDFAAAYVGLASGGEAAAGPVSGWPASSDGEGNR